MILFAVPSLVDEHAEEVGNHGPELLGLTAEGWVYAAITIFFLLAIFVFKAHRVIAEKLDAQIAETRKELDEARTIREEAAAMLAEAKAQQEESAAHAAAMIEEAQHEADAMLARAEADTTDLIARREKMAEEKIAAAERTAVADLRAQTARAAAQASRSLIAQNYGAAADRSLVDEVITNL